MSCLPVCFRTSASFKGLIGYCPRSGMLLTPRAPSTAVEGAAGGLGQDVFHVMLGVDQADRAVRLAVAILPGIDHELAVSDLHPAVTLLVQDRLVDAATLFVAQHHVYSGCGDVSGVHERGCSARLWSLSLSAMFDRMVSLSSGICARTMASASSKVRRRGGRGKLSATSSHSVSGGFIWVLLGAGLLLTPEPPPASADRGCGANRDLRRRRRAGSAGCRLSADRGLRCPAPSLCRHAADAH